MDTATLNYSHDVGHAEQQSLDGKDRASVIHHQPSWDRLADLLDLLHKHAAHDAWIERPQSSIVKRL